MILALAQAGARRMAMERVLRSASTVGIQRYFHSAVNSSCHALN